MLKKENAKNRSLFHIMTDVASRVASVHVHIDPKTGKTSKQIPSFNSRLTKDLIFGHKQENGQASVAGNVNGLNGSGVAESG
jgi:hypothetical protein